MSNCFLRACAADQRFDAYWSQKVQLLWQQFLLTLLKTNVIFCTNTSLISYGGSNSSPGGGLSGVFVLGQSPPLPYGIRRLCPNPDSNSSQPFFLFLYYDYRADIVVSNRHTHRQTTLLCSKRPHLCTLCVRAMRPNTTAIRFNHICSAL